MKTFILLFLLTSNAVAAEKKAAPVLIRIYVYAAVSKDGFVDSTRTTDTVKDLQGTLLKRKGVGIVTSAKDADLLLEVLGSGQAVVGTERDTTVQPGIFGGVRAQSTTQDVVLPSIAVRMHIRGSDYTKDFSATANVLWKLLAKNVGDQTVVWINTNWAMLQRTLKEKP